VHCRYRIPQRFDGNADIRLELLTDLDVFGRNEGPERFDGAGQIAWHL